MALGPLQLKPWEFWNLTWGDFWRMLDGYVGRELREWERTRVIATEIVNLMAKHRITPTEYMTLPGERGHRKKPASSWADFKRAKQRMGGSHE